MQFLYVDPSDYPVTREGIYQACYDEVVAEATDTGDLPMYGQQMLNQSAQFKFEDFMNDIQLLVGCLLYTSPSPRDLSTSRMPSSA